VEVEREVQVEVEVEVFRCTSETISRCTSETFLRCTSEAHASRKYAELSIQKKVLRYVGRARGKLGIVYLVLEKSRNSSGRIGNSSGNLTQPAPSC